MCSWFLTKILLLEILHKKEVSFISGKNSLAKNLFYFLTKISSLTIIKKKLSIFYRNCLTKNAKKMFFISDRNCLNKNALYFIDDGNSHPKIITKCSLF